VPQPNRQYGPGIDTDSIRHEEAKGNLTANVPQMDIIAQGHWGLYQQ
jgi:hypothetical protein